MHSRAARPDEAELLELPAHGTYFLVIERTHYVGAQPVATCDITFPGDRYELTYSTPVEGVQHETPPRRVCMTHPQAAVNPTQPAWLHPTATSLTNPATTSAVWPE